MEISRKLPGASLRDYRFHFDLDLCFRLRETPRTRIMASAGVLARTGERRSRQIGQPGGAWPIEARADMRPAFSIVS